ncbi:hypothetical protein HK100_007808 [Physocladia obscura]|uniref:Condensation domain-containing protein n=1 Tax=Physocladia obscura TaxID=109957 RepID=A0AAD5XAI6_9FUNG|nr:hypothetical protein HK100_007808 [Physocladia obscura]
MTLTTEKLNRPVGWLEDTLARGNLNIVAIVKLEGPELEMPRLEAAVAATQRRHANLRVNLTADATHFVGVSGAAPVSVYTVSDETVLHSQLRHLQHATLPLFSKLLPLWRIDSFRAEFIHATVFCISIHHAVADGTSVYVLLNDILSAYTSPDSISPPLPFLADVASLSAQAFGPNLLDDNAVLNKLIAARKTWKATLPTEIPPVQHDHDTRAKNAFFLRDIPADVFAQVLQRCHQERITVGMLLLAALHFSVARIVSSKGQQLVFPWYFPHDLDVNLRRRFGNVMDLGKDHVGLLIGMMGIDVAIESKDDTLFDFARRIGNWMYEGLAAKLPHKYHVANQRYDIEVGVPITRTTDLNFSNVGVYPFRTEYGDLVVTEFHEVGVWCPAVGTHVFLINTVNERLCCSWVYEESTENANVAKELLDSVVDLLEHVPQLPTDFTLDEFLNIKYLVTGSKTWKMN